MTIKDTTYHIILSEDDLKVWMMALRHAALAAAGESCNPLSCPFYLQHEELVRRTGLLEKQHEELRNFLSAPRKGSTK